MPYVYIHQNGFLCQHCIVVDNNVNKINSTHIRMIPDTEEVVQSILSHD